MRRYGLRCIFASIHVAPYIELLSDSKLLQVAYNGLMTLDRLLYDYYSEIIYFYKSILVAFFKIQ